MWEILNTLRIIEVNCLRCLLYLRHLWWFSVDESEGKELCPREVGMSTSVPDGHWHKFVTPGRRCVVGYCGPFPQSGLTLVSKKGPLALHLDAPTSELNWTFLLNLYPLCDHRNGGAPDSSLLPVQTWHSPHTPFLCVSFHFVLRSGSRSVRRGGPKGATQGWEKDTRDDKK